LNTCFRYFGGGSATLESDGGVLATPGLFFIYFYFFVVGTK